MGRGWQPVLEVETLGNQQHEGMVPFMNKKRSTKEQSSVFFHQCDAVM